MTQPAPLFTPKYTAIIDQRRADVRRQLEPIFAPGSGRFVWEIGCGHGHFLTAYAAAHPDKLCIGIDIVGERIERAVRKRDRAALKNLHFIHAEARLFLSTLPERIRFESIFLLFPDPWPKLRHNKHRLLQASFLEGLATKAEPNAPLYFRTDFTPYFEAAHAELSEDPYWKVTSDPWPFEFATVFQQRASSFHSLVARCTAAPPAPHRLESATADLASSE